MNTILVWLALFAANAPAWDITVPRGTPRAVDFVTHEGTWMSVDVSPDGRTLVFDLLAHIYRLDVAGGKATCLTQQSGIATNFHPRFSPDGRLIAFVSDRGGQNNLWVMDADGGRPRQVFSDLVNRDAEPVFSPDGRQLYATRFLPNSRGGWTKTAEIWRFPLTGGSPVKVLGTRETQVWSPSPSRDGRYLYFHQATEPIVSADGFYKTSDKHHIRRLDLSDGHTEAVTDMDARKYYRLNPVYDAAPVIAADGRTLAFVRNIPGARLQVGAQVFNQQTGLWLRDLDTGRERLLMHPITPAQFEFHSMFQQNFVPGYAFFPDGKSILLSQGGKLRRVSLADGRVTTIPFEVRVQRTMSEQNRPKRRIDLAPFEVKVPRWSATSPDGKALVFEAVGRLWRRDLPDGVPQRLTDGGGDTFELSPAWSPDGREIAFATWNDSEGGHLWKVAAAGGTAQKLTGEPGEFLDPVWTPDGRFIVVVHGAGAMFRGLDFNQNGWFDLVRFPAAGGVGTRLYRMGLPPGDSQFGRPFFGSDGRLYFIEQPRQSSAPGKTVLASVKPEGGDRRDHAFFRLAEDVRLSPDGRWVAFFAAHNVFVAPYATGGKPRLYDHTAGGDIRQASYATGRYPEWTPGGSLRFLSAASYVEYDPQRASRKWTALGLRVPADFAPGSVALTRARIITSDDPPVIENGTVVVKNGLIGCVGKCDTRGVDNVVDAKGKTIMPGIVDGHAHNHGDSPDLLRPHNPPSSQFLAFGVTTAHDPAARANITFQLGELAHAGRILGPRLFSAGTPLYSWGDNRHEIRTEDDAKQNVQRLAAEGALSVKQYFQLNRFQRQWIADAGRKVGNLLVTGEGMDLQYDLSTIMDGQTANEHPITQVPYYGDLIEFFARTGTHFSPTLVTPGGGHQLLEYFLARANLPKEPRVTNFFHWRDAFRQWTAAEFPLGAYQASLVIARLKALRDRGVLVALGGHGEVPGASSHFDLWLHAMSATPLDALRIATIETARHLGLDEDVGSIKVGKLADLVVLDANPLQDIRNTARIRHVMKGGRLFDSLTLDQIWPDKKPFGVPPGHDDAVLQAAGIRGDDFHDPR